MGRGRIEAAPRLLGIPRAGAVPLPGRRRF
jgi:hypothetical protein